MSMKDLQFNKATTISRKGSMKSMKSLGKMTEKGNSPMSRKSAKSVKYTEKGQSAMSRMHSSTSLMSRGNGTEFKQYKDLKI